MDGMMMQSLRTEVNELRNDVNQIEQTVRVIDDRTEQIANLLGTQKDKDSMWSRVLKLEMFVEQLQEKAQAAEAWKHTSWAGWGANALMIGFLIVQHYWK